MVRTLTLAASALALSVSFAWAEDLEFYLTNDSSVDLVAFNVSAAETDNWEENLIEDGFVAPGYEISVLIADGAMTCIYDMRGVFSDGVWVEDYGLDLCEMGGYIFSD
ncbi:hypothetical protein [Tritonibacter horizontis]|uniref:Argininosuccinate lyase n=1 Tax=Tritonibacter horizontis TaxID=1768241 RepID=A0A132C174_9RHOB|nr:hypothetical protein [Tritonibacter horizontis]KUP94354.1 hypothetical protein TRIHO_07690 [Tritonibacter horizontis]